jgi:hypothetical protein
VGKIAAEAIWAASFLPKRVAGLSLVRILIHIASQLLKSVCELTFEAIRTVAFF